MHSLVLMLFKVCKQVERDNIQLLFAFPEGSRF